MLFFPCPLNETGVGSGQAGMQPWGTFGVAGAVLCSPVCCDVN